MDLFFSPFGVGHNFQINPAVSIGLVWLLGSGAPRSLSDLWENRKVMKDGKLEEDWLVLGVLILFFIWGFCCC